MAAASCICGRRFTTRSGASNHGRKCPIERARSAAFVEATEKGLRGPAFEEHVGLAVAAAKVAHPKLVVQPERRLVASGRVVRDEHGASLTVTVPLEALRALVARARWDDEWLPSYGVPEDRPSIDSLIEALGVPGLAAR